MALASDEKSASASDTVIGAAGIVMGLAEAGMAMEPVTKS